MSLVRTAGGRSVALSLARAADEALGEPSAVVLLWHPTRRAIGLQPAAPGDPNAYPVRRSGRNRVVSAGAFVARHGLQAAVGRRYPAALEGGVLVAELSG